MIPIGFDSFGSQSNHLVRHCRRHFCVFVMKLRNGNLIFNNNLHAKFCDNNSQEKYNVFFVLNKFDRNNYKFPLLNSHNTKNLNTPPPHHTHSISFRMLSHLNGALNTKLKTVYLFVSTIWDIPLPTGCRR